MQFLDQFSAERHQRIRKKKSAKNSTLVQKERKKKPRWRSESKPYSDCDAKCILMFTYTSFWFDILGFLAEEKVFRNTKTREKHLSFFSQCEVFTDKFYWRGPRLSRRFANFRCLITQKAESSQVLFAIILAVICVSRYELFLACKRFHFRDVKDYIRSSSQWRILIQRSGPADGYKTRHCTLLLGFATCSTVTESLDSTDIEKRPDWLKMDRGMWWLSVTKWGSPCSGMW